MEARKITRRTFLMGSAFAMAGCATLRRPRYVHPEEKLNVAGIGVGGMGSGDIRGCGSENIVALCDVDWERGADSFNTFPNARRYKDFREILDKEKDIDAVVISTPDHTHAVAALAAIELGKHVRVQKPLTWSVKEARALELAARRHRVVTQMGNQGRAAEGVRQMCEFLWSDAIGFVTEAHIWTNRPVWPQGMYEMPPAQPIPDHLDWDLWLGPAQHRPYNEAYHPFRWRGWWDFGCGALGDMGCHIMDPAWWSLQLGAPKTVDCVRQEGNNPQTGPVSSVIKYEFPERPFKEPYEQSKWYGRMLPPVTVYWYDGGEMPPHPEGVPENEQIGSGDNGSYFIGQDGIATTGTYGGDTRLLPAARMADFQPPDPYIPRVPDGNSYREWIEACKGGPKPGSNFDDAGPFTEMVLLGNAALRAGRKLEWDHEHMVFTNAPEANQFLGRENRPGWEM